MIDQVFQASVKALSSCVTDEFAPLAISFVLHYLKGSKKTKTLPQAAIEVIRQSLVGSIEKCLELPSFRTLTCYIEDAKHNDVPQNTISDWIGLKGVVGVFEYEVVEINSQFIHVKCKDSWNFNNLETKLAGDVKSAKVAKLIRRLAKAKGIKVKVSGSVISVEERQLAVLNDKHGFDTIWEDKIDMSLFSQEDQVKLLQIHNKRFLLSKEDEAKLVQKIKEKKEKANNTQALDNKVTYEEDNVIYEEDETSGIDFLKVAIYFLSGLWGLAALSIPVIFALQSMGVVNSDDVSMKQECVKQVKCL